MSTLRIVVTVIYCIICVALAAVVLLQEGKQQGLGTGARIKVVLWKVILTRRLQLLPLVL